MSERGSRVVGAKRALPHLSISKNCVRALRGRYLCRVSFFMLRGGEAEGRGLIWCIRCEGSSSWFFINSNLLGASSASSVPEVTMMSVMTVKNITYIYLNLPSVNAKKSAKPIACLSVAAVATAELSASGRF